MNAGTGPPTSDDGGYPGYCAEHSGGLDELDTHLTRCRACPRLVAWREEVAATRRRAFRDEEYWARPVPGFGPPDAALAVVGLAPAAHGGNRTGRMFTGDASGDFLFAALHAVGLASQPEATHRGDGLELYGVRVTAPVHCAPPQNKPTPTERDTCRPWLSAELALLAPSLRAAVALGAFSWQALLPALGSAGWRVPRPRPAFGHGAQLTLQATDERPELRILGSYHPSQQNTFTGRLTFAMLVDVLTRAAELAGLRSQGTGTGQGRSAG
ncbi:uracil-DNA glycosylase [Streptomyces halobius]|uniref:Type-5 uracil-DNA glycosylase n=1 Tax=Streptomyces halobius TaxID=2879846 RepID=A0ABY4MGV0_9ACTN|nr:uracil-DNA glycosylase [Streptomyces halobius]UQA97026.1 uracil-DNA glycosylase [Streptomyces halobius]